MYIAYKALIAIAAVGIGCGMASAQAPAGAKAAPDTVAVKVQKPFSLSIGGYFPGNKDIKSNDGDLKNALSGTLLSYGLSYDFLKTPSNNPVVVSAFIDGTLPNSKTVEGIKTTFSYVGFGPQARLYFTPPTGPVNFFGGVGVGPYFVNTKLKANFSGETVSMNKTTFGGKLFVGAESSTGVFGTLSYNLISEVSKTQDGTKAKVNPSGLGLSVGYRF